MQYYKKVGATYRNPHYPGIRLCLFSWFNRWCFIESFFTGRALTLHFSSWWQTHSSNTATIRLGQIMFFDMACGSLIYYIIYIKLLPEVSSSCQAGRSCLLLSWLLDSSLTVLPSGEATLAFVEWCNVGKKLYNESLMDKDHSSATPSIIAPRRNLIAPQIILGPEFPRPQIIASDPVSAVPSQLPCSKLAHLSSRYSVHSSGLQPSNILHMRRTLL